MAGSSSSTRCIAVVGPSGSGKSTLAAALAGLEGAAADSAVDGIVHSHGFSYLGDSWVALDCPGTADLLQASSDVLQVSDAAVVCVSPEPEEAVLAAPFLRLAQDCGIPMLIFINRIRQTQARVRDIVSALQHFSSRPLLVRQVPVREGDRVVGAIDLISERAWRYRADQRSDLVEVPDDLVDREKEARFDLLESMSDFDETLLEQLIEDKIPPCDTLYALCSRLLGEGATVPVFFGDALEGNGVGRLMKALRHEAPHIEQTLERLGAAPLLGVFHAHHQKHLGKISHIRAFARAVASGDMIGGAKLGQLSALGGAKGSSIDRIEPGGVAAAIKTEQLQAGMLYDAQGPVALGRAAPALEPQSSVTVAAKTAKDDVRIMDAIARIAGDDRSLSYAQDPDSGDIVLSGQGDLHFRLVVETLKSDFGLEVEIGETRPSYRETIAKPLDMHYRHKKQSGGSGQFADIKFTLKPAPRGAGFAFEQTIHGGSVPRQYIPSVEDGMVEGLKKGPLGFPVVDLEVTLTDGQHHSVDSSDMAFKIAGQMGIKEALERGGTVLLEPIYDVAFEVPDSFTGALNPRIAMLHGQVLGFERDVEHEGWEILKARLPGKALGKLLAELRAATQGTGRYRAEFAHYQEVYGREAEAAMQ